MCVPIQGNNGIHTSKAEVIWNHERNSPYHHFSAHKVKRIGFKARWPTEFAGSLEAADYVSAEKHS